MGPDLVQLRLRLTTIDAAGRAVAADEVTDRITAYRSGYDDRDAAEMMRTLALARLDESDPEAGEAQLHALGELAAWHEVPADVLRSLRSLDVGRVSASEHAYLAHLLG